MGTRCCKPVEKRSPRACRRARRRRAGAGHLGQRQRPRTATPSRSRPTGARLADARGETRSPSSTSTAPSSAGQLAPTSELEPPPRRLRRHGAGAVVHTHAPNATALACVLEELPGRPLRDAAARRRRPRRSLRDLRHARSSPPPRSTALEGRNAALLANHGTIARAPTSTSPLRATELLEWSAELYLRAAALGRAARAERGPAAGRRSTPRSPAPTAHRTPGAEAAEA